MSIKFLLDENIPYDFIDFLEKRGFSICHLKQMQKSGIKNSEVYQLAAKDHMWIITRDADFQNYYKFVEHDIGGIIIFKTTFTKTSYLISKIQEFLEKHQDKLKQKHLIIIEDTEIKVYREE